MSDEDVYDDSLEHSYEFSEECRFANLVPGNWFELKNINRKKTFPYDIISFKDELIKQITDRSEKLQCIDSPYKNVYKNIAVEDIIFYLSETKFNNIVEKCETEVRHPIIAFHGSTKDAVDSILKTGYCIPKIDGNNVAVRHGSMYGLGVYTSPFFDKAISYSHVCNKDKYMYLIVNIVFLGKVKLIPPTPISSSSSLGKPVNGSYTDSSNTRVVQGLDQVISANSSNVIPVAVIKSKYK